MLKPKQLVFFSMVSQLLLSAHHAVFAADVAAGREIYSQRCVSCHGATANGIDAVAGPALAGQQEAYLVRQLENFNQGIRGSEESDSYGQQMATMAVLVKDSLSQTLIL